MINGLKRYLAECLHREKGQALMMVMTLLVMGSLTLPPLLAFMGASLKSGEVYKEKSNELYAADSGIEDGMWQIKYDGLEALYGHPDYAYDFTTNVTYQLASTVNGLTTNVTIQNVWFPSNITLGDLGLTAAQAKAVVERDITDNTTNRLVVTGTALDETSYRIKIEFHPSETETNPLKVDSIGIWLPQGFSYDDGCNLATFEDTTGEYTETVESRPGGEAVVWDFSADPLLFTDLPPVDLVPTDNPQTAEITFEYTSSDVGVRPAAVAWFVTSGDIAPDIPICWDIDTRYYRISSEAGDTSIEAYAARSELRNLYVATSGDYAAIGNSLMTDESGDTAGIRDKLWPSSTTTLSSNPSDACVTRAYLYWSGFFDSGFSSPSYWGPDNCSNWDNWDGPNRYWNIYSTSNPRYFRGYDTGSGTDTRYLEMNDCIDLSSCPAGTTILEWNQWESGTLEEEDALKFQLSSDNGSSWSDYITAFNDDIGGSAYSPKYYYYIIPEEYLTDEFSMRFYLESFNGSEYVYLDKIAVAQIIGTADTAVDFTIDGYDYHSEEVYALVDSVLGNKNPGQYSFACWQDVTDLVKAHSERGDGDDPTGNGDYTVGSLDSDLNQYLSYAGWSLIIIYHSPQTAGRQLYLWNTFSYSGGEQNLDFDDDGEPGGHIKGFIVPEQIEGDLVAAKLTCFVGEGDECYSGDTLAMNSTLLWDGTYSDPAYWGGQPNNEASPYNCWNGKSVGMNKDGVDVDTFTIYWDDNIIHADDTEAYVDLETAIDNYNLVYIILSVRSKTTISGAKHYVINN